MKNISGKFGIFIVISGLFVGCAVIEPSDFTYIVDNNYTGITLIPVNGYYAAHRACDSPLYVLFMFYTNGLFVSATDTNAENLKPCFAANEKSKKCRYPLWGTYRIAGDTIRTQAIKQEGGRGLYDFS